jgi:hypothetical protein
VNPKAEHPSTVIVTGTERKVADPAGAVPEIVLWTHVIGVRPWTAHVRFVDVRVNAPPSIVVAEAGVAPAQVMAIAASIAARADFIRFDMSAPRVRHDHRERKVAQQH